MTEQLWTHNTERSGRWADIPVVTDRRGISDDDLPNWHPATYDEQMAYETYWNAEQEAGRA